MSWIDELLPASFRGVLFHVKGDNASFGRRNQTHEFPFRDEPFTQDLGRSARQYAIDAYIVGDNFIDNEKRLIQAIEATGSGVLVHPFYGELSVNIVGTVRVSHSSDAGRMCSISFNFIESGEVRYPDVSVSTSDAILAQANAVDTTLSQSLVNFNFTKLPDFIQSEMLSSTQAALNEINYVLGYTNAQVKTAIDALSGNLSSVLSGPSHQLLTSLTGVWRNAEQVMYSVDGLIALSHTLSSVSDMTRLVPNKAWPTDSGSNQTRKHHQNHLNQVIRISALNASSRVIAMLPKQQITKHIIDDELTFQAVSIQDANEVKPLPMTFDDLMEIKKRINQTFPIYDLPNHPFTVFDNASQKIAGQGTLDSSGYAYVKLTPEVKYVDVVFDKQQQSRPWYYDVPLQFVGGLRDMAQSTMDLAWDTSAHKSITTIIARDTVNNPIQIPAIPQAETVAGSLTHGVTQFLAAFIPVARQLKVIAPLKNMGKLSRGMIAGGIADFTAFAPHEERLSNLIQSFPALQNPITEYLQAKPDDSKAEGRLKNALEGLMLGALTETFSHSLRALKFARIKWTAFEVKTKVHYKLEASQYTIKDVPESTPNFSAIDGNSKQIAIFMPKLEYEALLKDAIKNSDSNTMVLGKYTRDSSSYLAVAKENNAMYFDMGDKWGKIKNTYNLTDDSMFKLFNLPALDEAIKNGKTIKFTHDPVNATGALRNELKYLENNGYMFFPDTMSAILIK